MHRLLWKEWHEQSWKLWFSCIVLGSLAFIGFRSRLIADETMMMWVCFLGLTMLPVLSSTGLVPAERGEGSLETLLALPVRRERILAAKVLMGILQCVGPMVVAGGLSLLVAGGREMPAIEMIVFYLSCTVTTLCLFAWMMALTIRLPSETRAALLAMGVLILWMLVTEALAYSAMPMLIMAISPFALVYNVVGGPSASLSLAHFEYGAQYVLEMAFVLAVQGVIAAMLWVYTSRQLAD